MAKTNIGIELRALFHFIMPYIENNAKKNASTPSPVRTAGSSAISLTTRIRAFAGVIWKKIRRHPLHRCQSHQLDGQKRLDRTAKRCA